MAWDLSINRSDLADTTLVEHDLPELSTGQVLLRVDRVGMTANNVTYAVFGDAMAYWDFFPVDSIDAVPQGRVPLWGFAEVQRSTVAAVVEGTRFYGYVPTSSHLVVESTSVDDRGFRDASAHRQHLPSPYHTFSATSADPAYDAATEDLQVLYRPLFLTSFMLADFLSDNACFGADTVVITSASSKTAYGTAFLLDGVQRVGLTSPTNRAFTEGLGCYDTVLTYGEVDQLSKSPTVLVDIAGDATLRRRVHERVAPEYSAVVGAAHHDAPPDADSSAPLPGGAPTFFFAPDQMRKRSADWGPRGVEERHAQAWSRFAPVVAEWVELKLGHGPTGLESAWQETLAGRTPPKIGLVVQL